MVAGEPLHLDDWPKALDRSLAHKVVANCPGEF